MSDFFNFNSGLEPYGGFSMPSGLPTASGGYHSIGNIDGGTVYGSEGGSHIDWNSILNQAFGLGSQAIGAWGHNPTQQVGYGIQGYGQGYSPAAVNQSQAQIQQAIARQQAAARYAAGGGAGGAGGIGSTVGGGLDGIISWATANPLPVFLGIAGIFLLFREPPRGRR